MATSLESLVERVLGELHHILQTRTVIGEPVTVCFPDVNGGMFLPPARRAFVISGAVLPRIKGLGNLA